MSFQKEEAIRDRKLLDFARDQACCNCGNQDGTVIGAHANAGILGKGGRQKAHDIFHAHLCNECHAWLDQGATRLDPTNCYEPTREGKWEMFSHAMHKTWERLWRMGVIGRLK